MLLVRNNIFTVVFGVEGYGMSSIFFAAEGLSQ